MVGKKTCEGDVLLKNILIWGRIIWKYIQQLLKYVFILMCIYDKT